MFSTNFPLQLNLVSLLHAFTQFTFILHVSINKREENLHGTFIGAKQINDPNSC